MTTNPYINNADNDDKGQQSVYEDLVIEQIKAMGHTFLYLPRSIVKLDNILGEDVLSKFESNHAIEMYIDSTNGFEGEGDMIAKFGFQINDNLSLSVSKRRFREVFENIIERPREGDMIYFPKSRSMFEITFVEHENPFYQLGKLFVYKITAELFTYSHEDFETNYDPVDDINDQLENNNSVENDVVSDNDDFQDEGDVLNNFNPSSPLGEW